ncbi:MAG: FMN-binding negative transcriptional regulator, partial [Dechloromonas sp.]|nr:FMN-binding negative transcriptional regulator [Dechloromonas sp.]
MYVPRHFAEDDVAEMHALMRANPLATLVTHGPDGLN